MGKWDTDIKKGGQEFWDIQQKVKVEVTKAEEGEYCDFSAQLKRQKENRTSTGWSGRRSRCKAD